MESTNQKLVDELDAKQIFSKITAQEKARTVLNTPTYRGGIATQILMFIAMCVGPVTLFQDMPWPWAVKILIGLSISTSYMLFIEWIHIRRRLEAAIVLLNERESRDSH